MERVIWGPYGTSSERSAGTPGHWGSTRRTREAGGEGCQVQGDPSAVKGGGRWVAVRPEYPGSKAKGLREEGDVNRVLL